MSLPFMAFTGGFHLGKLVMTRGVCTLVESVQGAKDFIAAVSRHAHGDWGDLDASDKLANNHAVRDGDRLFSAYTIAGTKVWVITEADRSSTTVLLPEEY